MELYGELTYKIGKETFLKGEKFDIIHKKRLLF